MLPYEKLRTERLRRKKEMLPENSITKMEPSTEKYNFSSDFIAGPQSPQESGRAPSVFLYDARER